MCSAVTLLTPTRSPDEQAAALLEGAGLCAMEHLSVLAVGGADRASWLNGLVTNDVRALPPGASVYAAAVAVKGKILTDLHVTAAGDELLVVMPAERRDEVAAHFDRYVVMEDVTLTPRDLLVFTAQGPRARELSPAVGHVARNDRLGGGGVDVHVAPDELAAFIEWARGAELRGELVIAGAEAWERARVVAGVARFGVDFDVSNFVQEASITPRAVSFQKGCYLGQEVVCRLEMRGHVQRRLVSLRVEGAPPPRGAAVTADGKTVGEVSSVSAWGSGAAMIAMVRYAALESRAPLEVDGRPVTVVDPGSAG